MKNYMNALNFEIHKLDSPFPILGLPYILPTSNWSIKTACGVEKSVTNVHRALGEADDTVIVSAVIIGGFSVGVKGYCPGHDVTKAKTRPTSLQLSITEKK